MGKTAAVFSLAGFMGFTAAHASSLAPTVDRSKAGELQIRGDFDADGDLDRVVLRSSQDESPSKFWFYKSDARGETLSSDGTIEQAEKIFQAFSSSSSTAAPAVSLRSASSSSVERAEECAPQLAIAWQDMTALQRHLAFFDLDGDGKITLVETFDGLRDLGMAPPLALPAAIAINSAMATPTAGYPSLTIDLANIEAGIHGSDSGLYGNDGEFLEERFDRWFSKWDKDQDGALNVQELAQRLYQEMDLFDLFGVIASGGEYAALYMIAAEDGKISKARMRGLFTGTLFYQLAFTRGSLGCRFVPDVALNP